jgi:hypothetical protein
MRKTLPNGTPVVFEYGRRQILGSITGPYAGDRHETIWYNIEGEDGRKYTEIHRDRLEVLR